jgi:hypothetical protein
MGKQNPAIIPDDLLPIPEVAKKIGRPYSSVYSKARKGKIDVHFIAGDTQALISLSEARAAFSNEKPRFSAPSFSIVRHDGEPIAAPQEKVDLFS